MERILDRRDVCMPKSPEVVACVGPDDGTGRRIVYHNIAAAPEAKIILLLKNRYFTEHST